MLSIVHRLTKSATTHHTLLVGGGSIIAALAGVIGIRVFTELAPPSVFGEATLIMGAVTLGMQMMVAPITESQLRLYPGQRRNGAGAEFMQIVLRLALGAASVLCLFAMVGLWSAPSNWFSADLRLLAAIICSYILITSVKNVGINLLNTEHRHGRFVAWKTSEAIVYVIMGALFLSVQPSTIAFLAANMAAALVVAAAFLLTKSSGLPATLLTGSKRQANSQEMLGDIRRFGWPFTIFALLSWLTSQFDRFFLAAYIDLAVMGQYVAIFAIASRLVLLPSTVLATVMRPILFDAVAHDDSVKWRRTAAAWLVLTTSSGLIILAGTISFSNLIASILLAEQYRVGIEQLMPLVALSFVLLTLAQVVEQLVLSFKKSSNLLLSKLFGGMGIVAAAYVLVPIWGATGAAFASGVGHLVLLIVTTLLLIAKEREE